MVVRRQFFETIGFYLEGCEFEVEVDGQKKRGICWDVTDDLLDIRAEDFYTYKYIKDCKLIDKYPGEKIPSNMKYKKTPYFWKNKEEDRLRSGGEKYVGHLIVLEDNRMFFEGTMILTCKKRQTIEKGVFNIIKRDGIMDLVFICKKIADNISQIHLTEDVYTTAKVNFENFLKF